MIQPEHLNSIFLIGPMGAGKTTIGRLLSRHLDLAFVDVDGYIEEKTGADISWIFAKEGEASFRVREANAIQDLTKQQGIVLATGGGVVMNPFNRQLLSQRGLVIYLNANVEVQSQRTLRANNRPLLHTDNPKQILQDLYEKRHPLYQEIADIEMISGSLYPRKMALEIITKIQELGYSIEVLDLD